MTVSIYLFIFLFHSNSFVIVYIRTHNFKCYWFLEFDSDSWLIKSVVSLVAWYAKKKCWVLKRIKKLREKTQLNYLTGITSESVKSDY